MSLYNIYCDESCHLEHDQMKAMSLGAIWCEKGAVKTISEKLRLLKSEHGLSRQFEVKWTKVSPAKMDFYHSLVDYFFDTPQLHFRGVVIPDKSLLSHQNFGQDHDQFYYKMFFILLKNIFSPADRYAVYLDIKDTRSQKMVDGLHEILCNSHYDFQYEKIQRIQQIRSHEAELLQLSDLFIGALSYLFRNLQSSRAKQALIDQIKQRSGYRLEKSTLSREDKFNLFIWQARETQ
ncbi:MAG: DUF3800 domain-containing protein [bacterium]